MPGAMATFSTTPTIIVSLSSNGHCIRTMEKLAHEHLVDDSHPLRIRDRSASVKDAPPGLESAMQRNIGGGVYLIRIPSARLLYRADGYALRISDRSYGRTHANSGLLHSWDLRMERSLM